MPSARILVVDDDPDFVEIMRTILESNDYQVRHRRQRQAGPRPGEGSSAPTS